MIPLPAQARPWSAREHWFEKKRPAGPRTAENAANELKWLSEQIAPGQLAGKTVRLRELVVELSTLAVEGPSKQKSRKAKRRQEAWPIAARAITALLSRPDLPDELRRMALATFPLASGEAQHRPAPALRQTTLPAATRDHQDATEHVSTLIEKAASTPKEATSLDPELSKRLSAMIDALSAEKAEGVEIDRENLGYIGILENTVGFLVASGRRHDAMMLLDDIEADTYLSIGMRLAQVVPDELIGEWITAVKQQFVAIIDPSIQMDASTIDHTLTRLGETWVFFPLTPHRRDKVPYRNMALMIATAIFLFPEGGCRKFGYWTQLPKKHALLMTHINEIATMPPSPVKTAFMAIARYYYLEFIAGTRFADRPVAEYVDYGHGDMQVFEAFGNKKSFASPWTFRNTRKQMLEVAAEYPWVLEVVNLKTRPWTPTGTIPGHHLVPAA